MSHVQNSLGNSIRAKQAGSWLEDFSEAELCGCVLWFCEGAQNVGLPCALVWLSTALQFYRGSHGHVCSPPPGGPFSESMASPCPSKTTASSVAPPASLTPVMGHEAAPGRGPHTLSLWQSWLVEAGLPLQTARLRQARVGVRTQAYPTPSKANANQNKNQITLSNSNIPSVHTSYCQCVITPFLGVRVKSHYGVTFTKNPKRRGSGVKGEGLENKSVHSLANVGISSTFFFFLKKYLLLQPLGNSKPC